MAVKLAIIYYSSTGTNYQLAQWAAEGAERGAAQTRVLKVQELAPQSAIESNPAWKQHIEATKDVPVATLDDLEWADALIFSAPTRFGNLPAQMKQFLDTTGGLWFAGKLVNKVVSGMTSAQNPNGGQETTLMALYQTMIHWGAIIVPPGYSSTEIFKAGGNPYGASATAGKEGIANDVKDAVIHQARRTVEIAAYLKKGKVAL